MCILHPCTDPPTHPPVHLRMHMCTHTRTHAQADHDRPRPCEEQRGRARGQAAALSADIPGKQGHACGLRQGVCVCTV